MAEFKNYVEGQQIEPSRPIVYTTVEERAELKAYREFGNLSQLRVLCDNYHELLTELRSRPTESEIRAKAIDEFAEKLIELFCYEAPVPNKWKMDNIYEGESIRKIITEVAEQLKGE